MPGGVPRGALQGDLGFPEEWEQVGTIDKLFIYPVKSMAGTFVDKFTTGDHAAVKGHMVDRQLCVINKKGALVTARRYPCMTLIGQEVGENSVTLRYPGADDITVNKPDSGQSVRNLDIFGDACQGIDMGDEVGFWLSDIILQDPEAGLRLLLHPSGSSTRPDKPTNKYITPLGTADDKPYFADGYGYMMMTKPSVDELNSKLEESGANLQVEETRFRPNIFVTGDFSAFSEDKWTYIKIGSAIFRNVRLSDRCEFTTVDPFTGTKEPGGQPLKTLRTFRCTEDPEEKKAFGSSPFFGVNLGLHEKGEVAVGDAVYVDKKIVAG